MKSLLLLLLALFGNSYAFPMCTDGEPPLMEANDAFPCSRGCPLGFNCEFQDNARTLVSGICCANVTLMKEIYGDGDEPIWSSDRSPPGIAPPKGFHQSHDQYDDNDKEVYKGVMMPNVYPLGAVKDHEEVMTSSDNTVTSSPEESDVSGEPELHKNEGVTSSTEALPTASMTSSEEVTSSDTTVTSSSTEEHQPSEPSLPSPTSDTMTSSQTMTSSPSSNQTPTLPTVSGLTPASVTSSEEQVTSSEVSSVQVTSSESSHMTSSPEEKIPASSEQVTSPEVSERTSLEPPAAVTSSEEPMTSSETQTTTDTVLRSTSQQQLPSPEVTSPALSTGSDDENFDATPTSVVNNYSCNRERYRYSCHDGTTKTQPTIRWAYNGETGQCEFYPWGYCPGDRIVHSTTIRTKDECQMWCTEGVKHPSVLIKDKTPSENRLPLPRRVPGNEIEMAHSEPSTDMQITTSQLGPKARLAIADPSSESIWEKEPEVVNNVGFRPLGSEPRDETPVVIVVPDEAQPTQKPALQVVTVHPTTFELGGANLLGIGDPASESLFERQLPESHSTTTTTSTIDPNLAIVDHTRESEWISENGKSRIMNRDSEGELQYLSDEETLNLENKLKTMAEMTSGAAGNSEEGQDVAQPEVAHYEPEAQPEVVQSEPEVNEEQPEVEDSTEAKEKSEPEMDSSEPEVDQTEPEVDTSEPEMNESEPEMDSSEPEMEGSEPEVDQTQPELDSSEPEQDQSQPEVDSSEPEVTAHQYPDNETEDHKTTQPEEAGEPEVLKSQPEVPETSEELLSEESDVGIYSAEAEEDKREEALCQETSYRYLCKSGMPSQFVYRWQMVNNKCRSFPYGYCWNEYNHPHPRSAHECAAVCPSTETIRRSIDLSKIRL